MRSGPLIQAVERTRGKLHLPVGDEARQHSTSNRLQRGLPGVALGHYRDRPEVLALPVHIGRLAHTREETDVVAVRVGHRDV